MKEYQFELVYIEHEEFEMPSRAEQFIIEANGIVEAVRKADKQLHNWGVTLNLNDYNDYEYDEEDTRCKVSFGDADRGWMLTYEVEEI